MAHFIIQIIGAVLGFIGMILTFVVTGMPQWRTSVLVESNCKSAQKRIDGQWMTRWDGLWSTCTSQSNFHMQCNNYESLVAVSPDLKAGRVLMVFAIILSILAVLMAVAGMLFTRFFRKHRGGKYFSIVAGIAFIVAAILILIPVSWTTHSIYVEYDALCKVSQRLDIGEAIFLAWPTILFLLIAGIILCCAYPREEIEDCSTYTPSLQHSHKCLYAPCETEMQTRQAVFPKRTASVYSKSQYI